MLYAYVKAKAEIYFKKYVIFMMGWHSRRRIPFHDSIYTTGAGLAQGRRDDEKRVAWWQGYTVLLLTDVSGQERVYRTVLRSVI